MGWPISGSGQASSPSGRLRASTLGGLSAQKKKKRRSVRSAPLPDLHPATNLLFADLPARFRYALNRSILSSVVPILSSAWKVQNYLLHHCLIPYFVSQHTISESMAIKIYVITRFSYTIVMQYSVSSAEQSTQ